MRNYLLNDTCALFKTNPRLTGNVKIVVEDSKSFYLTQLDFENNYIKYSLQNDFAQNVSSFLRNYVKDKYAIHNYDLSTNNNLKTDYLEQYDLMYQYGAKYSKYANKLRFFAPLMFSKSKLPKFFVIAAKRKKSFTQSNLYDSMKFEIVKTFDLSNGYFKNIIESITSNAMYTDENMQYNGSVLVANGINIANGLMSTAKYNISKMQFDEYSITETNNVITNIFKNNNLIVSNIINFEYEFDIEDAGLYDIVGFYTNDINHTDITVDNTAATIYSANKALIDNTMTLVKSYNADTKVYDLQQFDVTKDYESTYYKLLRKVVSPNATLVNQKSNSFFTALVLKSIAIGDSITIIENGVEHKIYCDELRNDSKFFKYSASIFEQIENVKDCISRLATESVYKLTFNADNLLNIEMLTDSDIACTIDIPDAWSAINYKQKVESLQATNTRYSFIDAINIDDTIAINNVSFILSGINYNDIKYCTVKINNVDKQLTLKSFYVNNVTNTMYISFNETIEFDDSLQQNILIALYDIEHLQVCQMQFYDVANFDIDFLTNSVSNKHNIINNIQLFKQYNPAYLTEYNNLLSIYATVDDNPYVKNITANAIEYSTNEFDRLKEYDVASYALFNRINQGINKWSSIGGLNAYNKPVSMNMSIAYNQANLSPVFESTDYHNVHSLAFDYFLIGVLPKNIDDNDYAEYTAETIESLYDLNAPGALKRFFEHKIQYQLNDIVYYDVIKNYSTITKQDNVAKTIFKGVEYVFSSEYDNWSFTVVHVNMSSPDIFKVIVNNDDKAIIVAICKNIDSNILTKNYDTNELIVKRFMYYMNFADNINGTLNDRFYDIAFNAFCKYLTTNDYYMHYTLPSNIILNVSLAANANSMSFDIVQTDVNTYVVQKYALKLRPTVYTVLKAFSIDETEKIILTNAYENIKDYGIFKVGNATTLTTDDINSNTTPIHFLAGETVYDFIELNPIQQTKLHRFYSQKSNSVVNSQALIYNMSNCFSLLTVLNLSSIKIAAINTDTVTINVFESLKAKLAFEYPAATNIEQFANMLLSLYTVTLECRYKHTNELAMLVNSTTSLNKLTDNIIQFESVGTYDCTLHFSTK